MLGKILRTLIPEKLRPIGYLNHLTQTRTGLKVRSGIFSGMHYIHSSVGSAYIPKLLGIYERELEPCVEEIIGKKPRLIIDIGAAEGYYAVGLAYRLPETRVVAFEMEEKGRVALTEMARANNVSNRIEVRGRCEPDDLTQALGDDPGAVVICDVEGYEEQLLDPAKVKALQRASILVELHDFLIPGITETLKSRFQDTHTITHVWQEPRSRSDFPWSTLGTRLLPTRYLDWAVSEWRPVKMAWLWLQPK